MLDDRFAYEEFVSCTDAQRERLADELAQELTRRARASLDPAQAGRQCIDDLKSLGHDLWSFDEADEFQLWCGDWTAPKRAFELFVEITYREHEAPSVSVWFERRKESRR